MKAYLDLGSNIDKAANVRRGVEKVAQRFRLLRKSSVFETAPVGYLDQESFYNLSLEIETELEPEEIRAQLAAIESDLGRVRTANKCGPRTLDLDLILLGTRVEQGHDWKLPHPQLESQPFVLVPLHQLSPDLRHPVRGCTLSELLAELEYDPSSAVEVPDFW